MEGEDSLDEGRDPGRRAAELAQVPPGLEGGDGLFDQCPDVCVPVDGLLTGGEAVRRLALSENVRSKGLRELVAAGRVTIRNGVGLSARSGWLGLRTPAGLAGRRPTWSWTRPSGGS